MMLYRYLILLLFTAGLAFNSHAQSGCIESPRVFIDSTKRSDYAPAVELFTDEIRSAYAVGADEWNACLHYHYGSRHFREGHVDSAVHYFSQGAELMIKHELEDSLLLHKLLYNSGIAALRLRKYSDAIPWFKLAREYGGQQVDKEKCHIKIAKCYRESGELYLANHYLKLASRHLDPQDPNGLKWLIEAYGTLGINFNESDQPDSALYYLSLQRALIDAQDSDWIKASITNGIEMGNALESQSKFNQAIIQYNEALRTSIAEDDIVNQFRIYNNLGYTYNQQGLYLKAIVKLRRSLGIATEILQDSLRMSWVESTIGDTYLLSGVYEKAIDHYYQALILLTPGYKSVDHIQLPPFEQLRHQEYLQEIYRRCYDLANGIAIAGIELGSTDMMISAVQYVDLADSILFEINTKTIEDRSRFFWRSEAKKLYTLGIQLAKELEIDEAMFHYLERNKYFVLRSLIRDNISVSQANPSERDAIGRLREDIAANEVLNALDPQDHEALTHLIQDKEELHLRMTNIIRSDTSVQKNEEQRLSLIDFRITTLEHDSTLYVSYHFTDSKLFIMNIDMDSSWLREVDNSVLFDLTLKQFIHQVSLPFQTTTDEASFYKNSNYLYRQLLPLEMSNYNSLVVNPDGLLNFIPFDALCSRQANQRLVIHDQTVRYALTPYIKRNNPSSTMAKNTLLVAPVEFNDTTLAPLPYTAGEARDLLRITKGRSLTRKHGNKAEFLKALPHFDIIHLATHAEAGNSTSTLPWLALRDAKIYLPEMYQLPLDNKFVVLSACETFKGEEIQGEGILNLVWALHYGGARQMIATLWNAYDKSQNELMHLFYKELKSGYEADEALRRAKLTYMSQNRNDPCYWASPIFIGEPEPIIFKAHRPWNRPILAIFAVVLFLGILMARHYQNRVK